jgi:hypothetical protein
MLQACGLFELLKSPASLQALIGTNETLHLEVKEGKGPLSDELNGSGNEGLPRGPVVPSEGAIVYLGREGDVVHPGVNLDVTRTRPYQCSDAAALSGRANLFDRGYVFNFGIAAEDQPFEEGKLIIEDDELRQSVQRLLRLNPPR